MSTTEQDIDIDAPEIPIFTTMPRKKPQHMIIGDSFIAQTSDGELRVPLRFKTKLFRKILKSEGDEVEMFFDLIEGIGDTGTLEALDELDIFESASIAGAYFRAWKTKQQATPGEARRSSSS